MVINILCTQFLAEFLQKQLKNLKDSLTNCLDKRTKMTRSGAAASSLQKCRYFEQMAFLYGSVGNRPTESNLSSLLSPPTPVSTIDYCSDVQVDDAPSTSRITVPEVEREKHAQGTKRPLSAQLFSSNRSGNRMNRDVAELMILKQLSDSDAMYKKITDEDDDEDLLYCRSLVPILREMPDKKKRLAKIKISQLLFDIEFHDSLDD